jgi:hypothetical protein
MASLPQSWMPSVKTIPSLWIQIPDIHVTRVLFTKNKLSGEFIFPPAAIAPSLNM